MTLTACGLVFQQPPAGTAGASSAFTIPPPSPAPAQPHIIEHTFLPSQADSRATGFDDADVAMVAPTVTTNHLLFVFLPGTDAQPGCCTLLLRQAASLGFHALGLMYANSPSVAMRCVDNGGCYGTVRRNIFDGADAAAVAAPVSIADTVLQRLVAALHYLVRTEPAAGWTDFLTGNAPVLGAMVVGGHSQGGGEATFIATVAAVRGVVALSAPPDADSSQRAAPWLGAVNPALLPRIVAFDHVGDPFAARIRADWTAMHLDSFGPVASADDSPPYDGSHQLLSDAQLPAVALATHDGTAVDSATPLCPDGSPRYAPVWTYMLQLAAGEALSGAPPRC